MIEKQEKSVRKLEKEIEENTKIGELMYNKYQLIEGVLSQINLARKKHSWKEIKDMVNGFFVKRLKKKSLILLFGEKNQLCRMVLVHLGYKTCLII